jgi:hypothetical protein
MPEGHLPVRSYLAVPVKSRSGEVIGGLFFGHPDTGVFDEESERFAVGIAAQAAIALDNARLYAELKRSEENEKAARATAENAGRHQGRNSSRLYRTKLRTRWNAILGWTHLLRKHPTTRNASGAAPKSSSANARVANAADLRLARYQPHRHGQNAPRRPARRSCHPVTHRGPLEASGRPPI